MKKRLAAIGCILFIICQITTAQQPIFKAYTVEDGLVSNPVRCIYQDKRGFIWIGTWEGLSKYDGHKFTNYTQANGLSYNLVNNIYESADAKLYIAENNGAVDILQQDAIVKKGIFRNVIINRFHVTKNDKVLAATDTGLLEIRGENIVKPTQAFPVPGYIDIAELNDSLLIGGSDGSLRILNRRYGLFSEIKQPGYVITYKIFKDSKNRVWVGTNEGLKFISAVQKNHQTVRYTLLPAGFKIPILNNSIINDILEDADGILWIATSHGLVKIYPDGNWNLFSEKNGLSSSVITCLYQDKEKNIWIGTSLGLIKLVTENNIGIYRIENGLTLDVCRFMWALNNNPFIIGTETGMQLFNSVRRKIAAISLPHNDNFSLVQNSYPILFCEACNKFGKFDSVKQKVAEYVFPDTLKAPVFCSVMDAGGNIFNGTRDGLVIRTKEKSYYDSTIPYRITALLIDKKGYLWVGTWNNGLFRVHYASIKNKSGSTRISLSVLDCSWLVPDKKVRCLFEAGNGSIWIGTRYAGIVQLTDNGSKQYTARHFDLQQGLMSNWTRVIAEDEKGCFWIGSDLGIDKIIPTDSSFRVFNFSRVNNYFDEISAILPAPDHSLWFATNNGLVNAVDGEMEKMPPAPVYITTVKLGDSNFNYNTHQPDEKVQLKYFQNQASFEFSAPAFINEKQVLYSYRLLGGSDTGWSKPSNLHIVSYASLKFGNYRFEVRTSGWNGAWGIPANFIFTVKPPFWQTWWFYLLVTLLVLIFFYAFYLFRIKQLKDLQKVRNDIATDLHDDIGSALSNVSILSELTRKNIENPSQAHIFLNRISEEVQTSSQSLDDIIWSVNTQNDNWEETFSRMRRYAAEVFENDIVQYHFILKEYTEAAKLHMDKRRDIYLIYKEILNNIHKHANATKVSIDLRFKEQQLIMDIYDNGSGFEKNAQTHRNGLKNLSKRVARWNGKIAIDTGSTGTSIKVEI